MAGLAAVVVILTLGVVAAGADATAAHTVLMVWVGSVLISFGLSARLLFVAAPDFRFRCGWIWLSGMRGPVAWDYVATLSVRSPPFAIA